MLLGAFALVVLVAFTVEGTIGFGGTVVAVSLGAQLMPIELVVPAYVPINMCLSLLLLRRGGIAWRVLGVEIVPFVAVGAAAGLALSHLIAGRALLVGFGCFVCLLAALRLARRAAPPAASIPLLALGGIMSGLFGTGGPMIVYVARQKIADKTRFRSTLAVLWLALNTLLFANLVSLGRYTPAIPPFLGVAALAVVPGLLLGERLHRALDPARFERTVWIVLLLAGVSLAVRSAL